MNPIDPCILIVDDDKKYADHLQRALSDLGHVDIAVSEAEFLTAFAPYKYDLVLLDLRLREGKEGLDLLDAIIEEDPLSAVIIISGYGDIATAVEALKRGARTFLEKGKISPEEIKLRVEHTLKEMVQERRIRQLERAQETDEIIGEDPKVHRVREQIAIAAQNGETTVLILGETGTGKELVARAIHRTGVRSAGPFFPVSLVEKGPETITSELFGHEKGAFTGSVERRFGYFEEAHKGILFLDEIGDLTPEIQAKLLRVLDQKTFRRMGGKRDIQVDVQVLTATNRPLQELIREGRFREDLYYRLNPFEITLPPLRERRGDIGLLAVYFLNQLRKKGTTTATALTDEALDVLANSVWRGNIRELHSVILRAALECNHERGTRVTKRHIEPHCMPGENPLAMSSKEDGIFRVLADTELHLVEKALSQAGGKKTVAWKMLGYPDRFSMLRRVKRILKEYPDIAERYQEVKKSY
jgi:DNA-binding NtrC family response regulator